MHPEHLTSYTMISEQQARRIAADRFGIDADATLLDGLADQSFRLDAGSAGQFVLKVARPGGDRLAQDMQHALLQCL